MKPCRNVRVDMASLVVFVNKKSWTHRSDLFNVETAKSCSEARAAKPNGAIECKVNILDCFCGEESLSDCQQLVSACNFTDWHPVGRM